jgi:hypothetical protein
MGQHRRRRHGKPVSPERHAIFPRLRTEQIDLALLLEDTTTGMSVFFGEALAGDALAKATANILGLGYHIEAYLASPDPEHLGQASDALTLALADLKDAGLQAMGAYTIAAGLRLSVLQDKPPQGSPGRHRHCVARPRCSRTASMPGWCNSL